MNITIRPATIEDAYAIATIHVASWQDTYKHLIPSSLLDALSIAQRCEMWSALLKEGTTVLLAEKNNQLLGFASICPARDDDENAETCAEISAIYLRPNYCHQGIGTQLCSAAITAIKKLSYHEVMLWVLKDNMPARLFYESMGFALSDKSKIVNLDAQSMGANIDDSATVSLEHLQYRKSL